MSKLGMAGFVIAVLLVLRGTQTDLVVAQQAEKPVASSNAKGVIEIAQAKSKTEALSQWMSPDSGPTAYAVFRIHRQPPYNLFPPKREAYDSQEFENCGKNQVALVKSRPVLNAALRQAKVAPLLKGLKDPIVWLDKHLQVSFDKNIGLLRIALRSGPVEARVPLVDAVAHAYLEEVVYKENTWKLNRLSKLKEFYVRTEEDLRGKKITLKDMARSAGVNGRFLAEKQKLSEDNLLMLRKELVENLSSQRKVRVKLALGQQHKDDISHYAAELEYLKELNKELSTDFDKQAKQMKELRDKTVDLDFVQKEINSLETLCKTILSQKQQLEIELDAPPRVQLLEDARLED